MVKTILFEDKLHAEIKLAAIRAKKNISDYAAEVFTERLQEEHDNFVMGVDMANKPEEVQNEPEQIQTSSTDQPVENEEPSNPANSVEEAPQDIREQVQEVREDDSYPEAPQSSIYGQPQ